MWTLAGGVHDSRARRRARSPGPRDSRAIARPIRFADDPPPQRLPRIPRCRAQPRADRQGALHRRCGRGGTPRGHVLIEHGSRGDRHNTHRLSGAQHVPEEAAVLSARVLKQVLEDECILTETRLRERVAKQLDEARSRCVRPDRALVESRGPLRRRLRGLHSRGGRIVRSRVPARARPSILSHDVHADAGAADGAPAMCPRHVPAFGMSPERRRRARDSLSQHAASQLLRAQTAACAQRTDACGRERPESKDRRRPRAWPSEISSYTIPIMAPPRRGCSRPRGRSRSRTPCALP